MDFVNKLLFTVDNKFETVIKNEVNAENEAKQPKILEKIDKNEKPYRDPSYLHTFMRDCTIESPEPLKGVVEEEIPSWLNGTFISNGPGKRSFGNEKTQHAFDSAAMLRKFTIKDGEVTFQNKFLRSRAFMKNTEAQRIVVGEFGTAVTPDPCKTIFQKFASMFEKADPTDNCLVSLYPFNDELYAMTETVVLHRVDPQTLDTIKTVNLTDYVSIVHHTAHPHLDDDGTVYSLGMITGKAGPEYAIIEFPHSKRGSEKVKDVFAEGKIAAKVPCRWRLSPCYMHSFGMSPNYFVIVEQPLGISLLRRMIGKFGKTSFADVLKWYNEPTLIHVLSRETGSLVQTYEAEEFGFFHTINQFEEDGHIVIDICCYKDLATLDNLTDEGMEDFQKNPKFANGRGRPARFVCPLDPPKKDDNLVNLAGSNAKAHWCGTKVQVTAEILLDKSCDMPRINYDNFNGKKYKYFYCFAGCADDDCPMSLEKVDVLSKTSKSWSDEGVFPSEPIFVPRPQSEEEDDGVVLSTLIYGEDENKISLLVLDAKDMRKLAKVDFVAPSSIPTGFHGWFLKEDDA